MIAVIFFFFFNFFRLYSFLEFRNNEKFILISDFGSLSNNDLNVGIRIKSLEKIVSVFSTNYKVLYSKNRTSKDSILIIFDKDLNLNLEFFGNFFYKSGKIFFESGNHVFDVVVNDFYKKKIINPLFVIKNKNNLITNLNYTLNKVILKGKDESKLELSKNKSVDIGFRQYSLLLNFFTEESKYSKDLKGIYYFEVFLNDKSVFRLDFQSIILNNNSYFLIQDKSYTQDAFNLKKDDGYLAINDLPFVKGNNKLKIRYGDVYENENILTYRFKLSE